jgi:hypothetical protein
MLAAGRCFTSNSRDHICSTAHSVFENINNVSAASILVNGSIKKSQIRNSYSVSPMNGLMQLAHKLSSDGSIKKIKNQKFVFSFSNERSYAAST